MEARLAGLACILTPRSWSAMRERPSSLAQQDWAVTEEFALVSGEHTPPSRDRERYWAREKVRRANLLLSGKEGEKSLGRRAAEEARSV